MAGHLGITALCFGAKSVLHQHVTQRSTLCAGQESSIRHGRRSTCEAKDGTEVRIGDAHCLREHPMKIGNGVRSRRSLAHWDFGHRSQIRLRPRIRIGIHWLRGQPPDQWSTDFTDIAAYGRQLKGGSPPASAG
ncbi:MAG: hypothetical protein BWZ07_02903 [Alphaproteobacteria bacterium ADurb.BinA280]|nr:MAG: hypothetical protein BWZ07_02903 [Alphaproteobacteria bacterium ADurb.BinA280]